MKVAFFTSVAALVAGQPFPIPIAPPQADIQGPCWNIQVNAQCCLPQGCNLPPPPRPTFWSPWMRPPPQVPPYNFLSRVCCEEGKECCPDDFFAYQPTYTCCDSATQHCEITDNQGTCVDGPQVPGGGMTPGNVAGNKLDATGHCPGDHSLPIRVNPSTPFTCSMNALVPNARICPIYTKCVKDRQSNVNTGVCCFDTGCGGFTTCEDCVGADRPNTDVGNPNAGCSWLSQGNTLTKTPTCVSGCDAFPGKSCVLTQRTELCPVSATNPDGLVVNTGTCSRRCGMVGTGRSSGINNNGNIPVADDEVTPTTCCAEYPGDYCCSGTGALADHCLDVPPPYVPPNAPTQFPPIRPGFPRCGSPVRGTPNTLFNTPRPPPRPVYAPYYPRPMPFFGMPNMFWREYGSFEDDKEAAKAAAVEEEKQFMMTPFPWGVPFRPPPPRYPPLPPLHVVDQVPSEFICSCDLDCSIKYDDCCEDYANYCVAVVPVPVP